MNSWLSNIVDTLNENLIDIEAIINNATLTWKIITTDTLLVPQTGYMTSSGGLINVTLPLVAPVGSIIRITSLAGTFRIVQNAFPLQSINFGADTTTPGAGGHITSMDRGDTLELVCYAANTGFQVISCVGNFVII